MKDMISRFGVMIEEMSRVLTFISDTPSLDASYKLSF